MDSWCPEGTCTWSCLLDPWRPKAQLPVMMIMTWSLPGEAVACKVQCWKANPKGAAVWIGYDLPGILFNTLIAKGLQKACGKWNEEMLIWVQKDFEIHALSADCQSIPRKFRCAGKITFRFPKQNKTTTKKMRHQNQQPLQFFWKLFGVPSWGIKLLVWAVHWQHEPQWSWEGKAICRPSSKQGCAHGVGHPIQLLPSQPLDSTRQIPVRAWPGLPFSSLGSVPA